MARVCQITGKKVASGNNVPHSMHKTRRKWLPNLNMVSFFSETLGKKIRMKVTRAGMRTVEHNGGIDNYVLNTKNSKLSDEAKKIKKEIVAKKVK